MGRSAGDVPVCSGSGLLLRLRLRILVHSFRVLWLWEPRNSHGTDSRHLVIPDSLAALQATAKLLLQDANAVTLTQQRFDTPCDCKDRLSRGLQLSRGESASRWCSPAPLRSWQAPFLCLGRARKCWALYPHIKRNF